MFGGFFIDPARPAAAGGVQARRPLLAFACFTAALAGWLLWVEGGDVFESVRFQIRRRDAADPAIRAALTAAAYGLGVLGLALCCRHAAAPVRGLAWALVFLATANLLGWQGVNGTGFSLHEATLVWREMDYAGEALAFFFGRYALGVVFAAAATTILALAASRWVPRVRPWWVCALPVPAFLLAQWIHTTSFAKIDEFPAPYRVPILLAYAWGGDRLPYYGPREAPYLEPAGEPAADHIVFIVDESVSGDLLGINGGPAETTPFLASLSDRVANYGVASAISNLSSTTNLLLMSGLRADELPDPEGRSLRMPSLFAYMDGAGFSTFYLDAQTYGPPSNFVTRFDLDALDGFLQIIPLEVGAARHEIDHRIIDHLERTVADHPRSFSYVLKAGAHIHYEGRYPESARVFRPTLAEGELDRLDFSGADRERTLNSYLNAMRWTVDGFWSELLPRLEATGRDVLVVYTSDHGQSILEPSPGTGRPEQLSHNTRVDPPVFQAMVPIFLVAAGEHAPGWLAGRSRHTAALEGRVSQFALFPTLLVAAGYDPAAVAARYGSTLFDPAVGDGDRHFVSGDHFGRRDFHWNPYRPTERP